MTFQVDPSTILTVPSSFATDELNISFWEHIWITLLESNIQFLFIKVLSTEVVNTKMSDTPSAMSAFAVCPFFFNHSYRCLQSFFQWPSLVTKSDMPLTNSNFSFLLFLSFLWPPNLNFSAHLDLVFFWSRLIIELSWSSSRWEFSFHRVWWLWYDHMTTKANWQVLTPCPSRRSSQQ